MRVSDEGHCRQCLEVSADASMDEITLAYHRLKRIYQDDCAPFTAPSMDEFSEEARGEILDQIEAAYRELCRILVTTQPQAHPAPPPTLIASLPVDGAGLRGIREAEGLTLEFIAAQTHVRQEYLQAFEEERFADLPHAVVNVRGFLSAYVAEMGLPVDAIVRGYMLRYQQWQARQRK
jgi:hypothetical protein